MVDLTVIARLLDERRPGHSLPQALYNSQGAFDFDMEAIFGRSWILVGFEVELPSAGSWMAMTVGPWPVLVTRDRHGELHAFHNTCRHRGAQICPPARASAARLVCPYHRWTYELTGELVARRAHGRRLRGRRSRPERRSTSRPAAARSTSAWPTSRPTSPTSGARFEPLLAPHRSAPTPSSPTRAP